MIVMLASRIYLEIQVWSMLGQWNPEAADQNNDQGCTEGLCSGSQAEQKVPFTQGKDRMGAGSSSQIRVWNTL